MISLQGNKLCKASSGSNLALMSSFLFGACYRPMNLEFHGQLTPRPQSCPIDHQNCSCLLQTWDDPNFSPLLSKSMQRSSWWGIENQLQGWLSICYITFTFKVWFTDSWIFYLGFCMLIALHVSWRKRYEKVRPQAILAVSFFIFPDIKEQHSWWPEDFEILQGL